MCSLCRKPSETCKSLKWIMNARKEWNVKYIRKCRYIKKLLFSWTFSKLLLIYNNSQYFLSEIFVIWLIFSQILQNIFFKKYFLNYTWKWPWRLLQQQFMSDIGENKLEISLSILPQYSYSREILRREKVIYYVVIFIINRRLQKQCKVRETY